MSFEPVALLEDLWMGEMLPRTVSGKKLLVVRLEDAVHVFEDRCAHLGVALSEGTLENDVLVCSAHHYQYDAKSGAGLNPKNVCLTSYPVRIEGAQILVDVEQPSRGGQR